MHEGTWVDLGIVAVLFLAATRGYFKGFLRQTAAILGIVLGIFVALHRYHIVSEFLTDTFLLPTVVANIFGFIIITIVVSALINLLGALFHKLTQIVFIAFLDNIGGAGLGLIKGGLLVYFLLLLISRIPYDNIAHYIEASTLARGFLQFTPVLQKNLDHFLEM